MKIHPESGKWALILGGSKGLGMATAKKLAKHGFGIFIVHRDLRTELTQIEAGFDEIRGTGVPLITANKDATKKASRVEIINQLKDILRPEDRLAVLVHSIAKGSVKPMWSEQTETLSGTDFEITINAMALSLYEWTKDLVRSELLTNDARIVAFTSEGNTRAFKNYAAVSAAKSALEAITRNIALEMAPLGIKANCVQAGVTETDAFKRIPGSEVLKEYALRRNPNGRLTRPEDVADVVYLLSKKEAQWITGTTIKVDGGESLQ